MWRLHGDDCCFDVDVDFYVSLVTKQQMSSRDELMATTAVDGLKQADRDESRSMR